MISNRLFRQIFVPGSSAVTANSSDIFSEALPSRMTRAPKILPWMARKAGISDERSQSMWREAVCYATRQTDSIGNADYSRVVMERLRKLVEREKVALAR